MGAEKKLYEVQVELRYYVLASSEAEAREDFFERMRDELDESSPRSADVNPVETVFYDWANREPHNGDGRTCAQLAAEARETAEFDKRQIKMF